MRTGIAKKIAGNSYLSADTATGAMGIYRRTTTGLAGVSIAGSGTGIATTKPAGVINEFPGEADAAG